MKSFLPTLLLSLLAVGLAGCETVTSTERRIAAEPAMFDELSSNHRDLVQQGRVTEGMSKDAVYLAWGRPQETKESSRDGKSRETWVYYGSESVPVRTVGVGVGYGYGDPCYRYGGWGGPFYDVGYHYRHRDYVAAKVEFEKGRVVFWERNERR